MSNARSRALISYPVRHRFYGAVVFLSAITQAYNNNRQPSSYGAQWSDHSRHETLFKDFVNKLSQFCDVRLGGNSVTAFTVLNLHDHVEYRFACNKMNKTRLVKVADYMTDLLQTLHDPRPDADFRSLLLGKVLSFCRNRIHYYLGVFKEACRACEATQPTDPRLKNQLGCCEQAAKAADFGAMPQDEWVPKCEVLMTMIEEYCKARDIGIFAERGSQGIMNPGSNCWSELRHYAGRLRSYSQGTKTLIEAAEAFPMLFENFQVTFVTSSSADDNPFQKQLPASKILSTMLRTRVDSAKYIQLFEGTQSLQLNVNQVIQDMMADETFKPIVHAELLVLQSLEKDGLTHPSQFFNSWMYIGSSKPTCRLCHLYFQERHGGFQVRPSHGNLYINWKPPDVFQNEGEVAIKARESMLNAIVVPIRRDALRTLDNQVPLGRQHDSSTGMTVPVRAMTSVGSAAGASGAPGNDDGDDDGDMETYYGE